MPGHDASADDFIYGRILFLYYILRQLVHEAKRGLKPAGLLVLETPTPRKTKVSTNQRTSRLYTCSRVRGEEEK